MRDKNADRKILGQTNGRIEERTSRIEDEDEHEEEEEDGPSEPPYVGCYVN